MKNTITVDSVRSKLYKSNIDWDSKINCFHAQILTRPHNFFDAVGQLILMSYTAVEILLVSKASLQHENLLLRKHKTSHHCFLYSGCFDLQQVRIHGAYGKSISMAFHGGTH